MQSPAEKFTHAVLALHRPASTSSVVPLCSCGTPTLLCTYTALANRLLGHDRQVTSLTPPDPAPAGG